MSSLVSRITSWMYTPSAPVQVTIPPDTLRQIRQLQSKSEHEWVGHFDIGRDGTFEGISYSQGMSVPEVSRDNEVSWHTHPTSYDNAFPDWPSRQDMSHVMATVGVLDEVHTHMVFTPRVIYAIGVSAELRQRIHADRDGSFAHLLQSNIATTYQSTFAAVTPANQLTAAGESARVAWIRRMIDFGFDIQTWSAPQRIGAVYDKPVMIQVVPKELSPTRVVLGTAGALAAVLVAHKLYRTTGMTAHQFM